MKQTIKYFIKRSLQHLASRYWRYKADKQNPRLVILMYHRILPKNDARAKLEEPGMMVTPETFRLHMQTIQQHFNIISLSEWVQRNNNHEPLPPRCCAITFDDGWLDNYEYAYPVLKEYKLPATIFVVSDMIDTNQLFWPERLARTLSTIAQHCPESWSHPCLDWLKNNPSDYKFNHIVPNQEQLSLIINHLKSLPDNAIHQLLDDTNHALQLNNNPKPSLLNWPQLKEMSDSGLIEIGSHTCQHIRLDNNQKTATLAHEITQSKIQIEEQLKKTVNSFCYPNGDFCDDAINLVSQHYHCGVTTKNGWNSTNTTPHLFNRIGIHEDISADKTAFLARLSGWM